MKSLTCLRAKNLIFEEILTGFNNTHPKKKLKKALNSSLPGHLQDDITASF